MSKFLYSQPDNAVLYDIQLPQTAYRLYNILADMSDRKTRKVTAYVATLAKRLNRSVMTTRRTLGLLVNFRIIEREFNKSPHNAKMNLASTYTVRGRLAERYVGTEYAGDYYQSEVITKTIVPPIKNGYPEYTRGFLSEKVLEDTLRRENESLPKEYTIEEAPKSSQQELIQAVPEIMRTTAEYLLLKTGRTSLKPKEVKALIELAQNHMPSRVQKEIDTCVERFRQNGKRLSNLYAGYIATCLREQKSLKGTPSKEKPAQKDEKTKNSTPSPEVIQVDEPKVMGKILPVEEAEKIISEYTPAMKECKGISTELEELHERIRKKGEELAEQYFSKYPKDENGCYIFPEVIEEDEDIDMTLDDYLRLKFPNAEEEKLRTDRITDKNRRELQEAFKIDRRCANCTDPETCPFNRKNGRPVAMIKYGKLAVGYTTHMSCKHDKDKPNPEFEYRVKKSGLTEAQTKQTFTEYSHTGMSAEVVSAKAKAILAAKNKTSLILSGKPGTGKTHLAVAIALEAMRGGKQALFRTVPDLIAELRQADWDHADFFGLRQKFRDVPCLVLDDWGKEKMTEKGMEYLYQIIDYRYRKGLQTVVTTNGLKGDVEALVSRILENGEWVSIRSAENHRLKRQSLKGQSEEPEARADVPEVSAESLEGAVFIPEELSSLPEEPFPEPELVIAPEPEQNMLPEYDSPSKENDGFRSLGAILRKEQEPEKENDKPKSIVYKYCPNYDRLDDYDKVEVMLWLSQNYERLEAEEATRTQQAKPERDPAYDDEDLWKEDEDEYRLAGDGDYVGWL